MKLSRVSSKALVVALGVMILKLFVAGGAMAQSAAVSNDIMACENPAPGSAFVRVSVEQLKDTEGNIRVQVYGPSAEDFLEKGKKLVRIDVKTEGEGQQICVPMPSVGDFTLVVMHDRNANGKADFFSEGFGFSNNPKLGLGKPDVEEVVFSVEEGVTDMPIRLKYIFGADEEQKKKRRNLRRR